MRLFSRILQVFQRQPEIDWDDLEAMLVRGDLGIRFSGELIERLQDEGGKDIASVLATARRIIGERLPEHTPRLEPLPDGRTVIVLVVGVNGSGKTTSTAKLAAWLKQRGHSVVMAAADTFRAAAVEQLEVWGRRLDVPVVKGPHGADPSSVCHEACNLARREGARFLLCDTAGRLHTRHNLMSELEKIRRTVGKGDPTAPHHTLLVVDATTGSNAIQQAKEFNKATPLSGIIVTKLDGSGKGGVIVGIHEETGVPPVFIGTGETAEAFAPFDRDTFVRDLL